MKGREMLLISKSSREWPPLTYLTRLLCTPEEALAALRQEDAFRDTTPTPTLVGNEVEEEGLWELLLYTEGPPARRTLEALAAFSPANRLSLETTPLPSSDWVTLSQAGTEPVNIGRFHIHTDQYRGQQKPGQYPIEINAGRAFGTGQHPTTGGCLSTLTRLAKYHSFRNILDVGTGSGILLFAARHLWRGARLLGTDLDAAAVDVARHNAAINHMREGHDPGQLCLVVAAGTRHATIWARRPYDLVFANILARPLVALAPEIAPLVAESGYLLLSGLLRRQIPLVLSSYRARGLYLAAPPTRGDWPAMLLRRRGNVGTPVIAHQEVRATLSRA